MQSQSRHPLVLCSMLSAALLAYLIGIDRFPPDSRTPSIRPHPQSVTRQSGMSVCLSVRYFRVVVSSRRRSGIKLPVPVPYVVVGCPIQAVRVHSSCVALITERMSLPRVGPAQEHLVQHFFSAEARGTFSTRLGHHHGRGGSTSN